MSVVNPDDLSDEKPSQPDFTVFQPPQTVLMDPYPRRRGGARSAAMVFLAMLIPVGLLGYFAYSQNQNISNLEQALIEANADTTADSAEQLAEKDLVIASLRDQVSNLETQIASDDDIAKLIADGENKLQEIQEMLAGPKRGWGTLERRAEWATEDVEWDEAAETILTDRVERLENLRRQIRDWVPPARTNNTVGAILPSE